MASGNPPREYTASDFARAARDYMSKLPLEHFTEATPQATQRKITVVSMDLVHAHRPDIQTFNELLVQKRIGKRKKLVQVVPDNMVVVCPEPIQAVWSYDLPLQPVGPLLVLDYVSRRNKRKDYAQSLTSYEQLFQVPYCVVIRPEDQVLTVLHLQPGTERYATVEPNSAGRYPIPELELELGLLDGWVRFWFRGELLPFLADLQRSLDEKRAKLAAIRQQKEELDRQNEELAREKEDLARQNEVLRREREELERMRARLIDRVG